jgi:hypothetical protein
VGKDSRRRRRLYFAQRFYLFDYSLFLITEVKMAATTLIFEETNLRFIFTDTGASFPVNYKDISTEVMTPSGKIKLTGQKLLKILQYGTVVQTIISKEMEEAAPNTRTLNLSENDS